MNVLVAELEVSVLLISDKSIVAASVKDVVGILTPEIIISLRFNQPLGPFDTFSQNPVFIKYGILWCCCSCC